MWHFPDRPISREIPLGIPENYRQIDIPKDFSDISINGITSINGEEYTNLTLKQIFELYVFHFPLGIPLTVCVSDGVREVVLVKYGTIFFGVTWPQLKDRSYGAFCKDGKLSF